MTIKFEINTIAKNVVIKLPSTKVTFIVDIKMNGIISFFIIIITFGDIADTVSTVK